MADASATEPPNTGGVTLADVAGGSAVNAPPGGVTLAEQEQSEESNDHHNTEGGKSGDRQLHILVAHILMNIMYGARFARPDLLRAVCVLARRITKWDEDCDKRLLRLVTYINSTLHYRLQGVDRRSSREA